jgi:hypothetical protein
MMYKAFWVFTQRLYLVRDQRFGTACVCHHQGLNMILRLETQKHLYVKTMAAKTFSHIIVGISVHLCYLGRVQNTIPLTDVCVGYVH